MRPTLADFVLKMPRGAQVIYPKDLGPILLLADVFPGARVLESGVGSGACRRRCCGPAPTSSATSSARTSPPGPSANVGGFLGEEALARYRVEIRDCYEGIDETDLDRIVLDLPEPWRVVPHAVEAMHAGGILVAYTPTIEAGRPAARRPRRPGPFGFAETIEVLHRGLAHRGPVGAARPPHGRPHRLPDHARPACSG